MSLLRNRFAETTNNTLSLRNNSFTETMPLIKQIETSLGINLTQKNLLVITVACAILLIIAYIILFAERGSIDHTTILVGILGGLISSGIINLTYFLADDDNNSDIDKEINIIKPKQGGGNISMDIDDDGAPIISFKASQESAGGVVVSNPEQHLYTAAIMKLHHKTKDARNNRELKMLIGNAAAVQYDGDYKLLIKDRNVVYGKGKKLTGKHYYVRIYRQIKPIEYKSPKDPKNYDIEQIADAHNLQSLGELMTSGH